MRLALVLWLCVLSAPGLGEIAESVGHLVTAGHLAHTDADHGDLGDQGSEHGCGTTQHRCSCCPSQLVLAGPGAALVEPVATASPWQPDGASLRSLHEPAPLRRPPIAS